MFTNLYSNLCSKLTIETFKIEQVNFGWNMAHSKYMAQSKYKYGT